MDVNIGVKARGDKPHDIIIIVSGNLVLNGIVESLMSKDKPPNHLRRCLMKSRSVNGERSFTVA